MIQRSLTKDQVILLQHCFSSFNRLHEREKVDRVVEFVDSKGTERLRGLIARAKHNKERVEKAADDRSAADLSQDPGASLHCRRNESLP